MMLTIKCQRKSRKKYQTRGGKQEEQNERRRQKEAGETQQKMKLNSKRGCALVTREGNMRGEECCEGCWIKHVEIRAVPKSP